MSRQEKINYIVRVHYNNSPAMIDKLNHMSDNQIHAMYTRLLDKERNQK